MCGWMCGASRSRTVRTPAWLAATSARWCAAANDVCSFQLLLRQCEHLFIHQRRHRDLNPLRAGTLMTTNVATRQGFPLTERARDTLPGPLFGLAIASSSPIRGIA